MPRYTRGNRVEIYRDGTRLYPDILESIQNAEEEIHVEYYIVRADRVGMQFVKALIAAAKRGVDVKVILDGYGTFRFFFPRNVVGWMREAGVKFAVYNPLRLTATLGKLAIRNHRKTVIVDNEVAYVGGANIKDYAKKGSMEAYRGAEKNVERHDTHMKIAGPVVNNINLTFRYYWRQVYGRGDFLAHTYRSGKHVEGGVLAKELPGPMRHRNPIIQEYIRQIRGAEETIRLVNSYFLPPSSFLRELYDAVDRGVRVQLMVPGIADISRVKAAMWNIADDLLENGVELYEYRNGILHSKTAVVDDAWATVGSFNLDYQSFLRNQELNVEFRDSKIAETMNGWFKEDITDCERVTEEELERRPSHQKAISNLFHRMQWAL